MDFYLNHKRIRNDNRNKNEFFQNKPFLQKEILVDGIWKCCFDKNLYQQGGAFEQRFRDYKNQIPIGLGLKIINESLLQIKLSIGKEKMYKKIEQNSIDSEEKNYSVDLSIDLKKVISERYSFQQNYGEVIKRQIKISHNQRDLINKYHSNEKCFFIQIKIKYNNQSYNKENLEENKFSGLKNMGATCYLNSIIQLLFSLSIFKKNIFECEFKQQNFRKNKIYCFQKLFYNMLKNGEEKNKNEIKTDFLMQAFGMKFSDAYIQNDIQEFFITLSENMEKDLKDKNIETIFGGKLKTIIKCTDINYSSEKEDSFSDIQLPTENCKDIYDCLNKFTEKAYLNGENQYETDKFGKQNAIKETFFSIFPKVLCLQLNRFILKNNSYEKNNDEIKYYKDLDLSKYYFKNSKYNENDSKFILHAVIVHKGNIDRGHYKCYIKEENGWYLFNDSKVNKVDEFEAIDFNFGGDFENYDLNNGEFISSKNQNLSNAYLLIYIQKKEYNQIIFPFSIKNIPKKVLDLFDVENREILKENYEKYVQENFIEVYIINNKMIDKIGIIENGNDDRDNSNKLLKLKVHKDIIFIDFIKIISNEIAIDINNIFAYKYIKQKAYNFVERYNYQMEFIQRDKYNYTLSQIYSFKNVEKKIYMFIYAGENDFMQQINIIDINDIPINFSKNDFYEYNNDFKETINHFYYLKDTYYIFKKCSNIIYSNVTQEIEIDSLKDQYRLLFLKIPIFQIKSYNNKYECINLENKEIIQLKNNEQINEKLQKNQLIEKYFEFYEKVYDENDISKTEIYPTYLFLRSSLDRYLKYKNLDFKFCYEIKGKQTLENFNNDGFCVILNFGQEIQLLIKNYLNHEFKDIKSVTFVHKDKILENKLCNINIDDEEYNEKKIRQILYETFKNEKKYKLFGYNREFCQNIKDYYIIDPINLTERIKHLNICPELFQIIKRYNITNIPNGEIFNFINPSEKNEIQYYLKIQNLTYQKYNINDSVILEIILCNQHGPQVKFYLKLSYNRGEIKYSKILEYIFQYYFKYSKQNLKSYINTSKYNLILYNPYSLIAYELFELSNGKDLENPISENCLHLHHKEFIFQELPLKKGEKLFICIYYSENGKDEPLYLPYVGYFEYDITYIQFRKYMINYYSNINFIKDKFGDLKTNDEININFYCINLKTINDNLSINEKIFLDTKQNYNLYIKDLLRSYQMKNFLILISNKIKY